MIETDPRPQQITMLASVPLTDKDWHPLEEGEVLAVRYGQLLASAAPPTGLV